MQTRNSETVRISQKVQDMIPQGGKWIEIHGGARLLLIGPEARDLLQRITTNDLSKMSPGDVKQTIFTNEKGRIVAVVSVVVLSDDRLLLIAREGSDEALRAWIGKFIIMENIEIQTLRETVRHWICFDPGGSRASGAPASTDQVEAMGQHEPAPLASKPFPLTFVETIGGALFVHVLGDAHTINRAFSERQVVEAGPEVFDHYRIMNGVPAYESEINQNYNPLEAGLGSLVSFSKGCYVGQEIIARLDTYQKVQRAMFQGVVEKRPSQIPSRIVGDQGAAGIVTSCSLIKGEAGFPILGFLDVRQADRTPEFLIESGSERIPIKK